MSPEFIIRTFNADINVNRISNLGARDASVRIYAALLPRGYHWISNWNVFPSNGSSILLTLFGLLYVLDNNNHSKVTLSHTTMHYLI